MRGDERAVARLGDPAAHRLVANKDTRHDALTARQRQEHAAEADEASRGDAVLEPYVAGTVAMMVYEAGGAVAQLGAQRPDVAVAGIDDEMLDRLTQLA